MNLLRDDVDVEMPDVETYTKFSFFFHYQKKDLWFSAKGELKVLRNACSRNVYNLI